MIHLCALGDGDSRSSAFGSCAIGMDARQRSNGLSGYLSECLIMPDTRRRCARLSKDLFRVAGRPYQSGLWPDGRSG